MKKLVVIFRFGSTTPTVGDMRAMEIITEGSMHAMGCPTPVGIASVVYTNFSIEEISNHFKTAAEEASDLLPILAFYWGDENIGVNMECEAFLEMMSCADDFIQDSEQQKPVVTLSLDDVLDKISREGIDSLSQEEMTLLINESRK